MTTESDEVLMKLVQEGNLNKSSVLFERYNSKVYNYFLKITFNEQLSMDLAQNTFYRMLHYRSTYKNDFSFKSWLFSIARNVFFDSAKSIHSKTTSIDDLPKYQQIESNEAIRIFENEALYHSFNLLSIEEREILILSRFENMKYNEIAEIKGLSLSAVKVKVHRAIKKLREHYFKDDLKSNIRLNAN